MADYGPTRRFYRDKLQLRVLTGFYPTEPLKLQSLATGKSGEGIKSGMAIKKDESGEFIVVPNVGQTTLASFYIALHDQDAHDVQAAGGKLIGLDCSDSYEVQTGYFDPAETYEIDTELTVKNGLFVPAVAGEVVVGLITVIGAEVNGSIAYSGFTPPADPSVAFANSVIQFKTVSPTLKA